MPTTLPARATRRYAPTAAIVLFVLSIYGLSLMVFCAGSGGSGDVVDALSVSGP